MDFQAQLVQALVSYGAIAVFVSVLIASIGVPLPASFLLVVAGSFVSQGELDYGLVLLAAISGAVLGDHCGYGVGRWGGRGFALRISQRLNATSLLERAESTSHKWGGLSVFLSRWLITAVGPYVNLSSGITGYALPRFFVWVALGETLWVALYVQLGIFFNDRLTDITDLLGDATWVILGIVVTVIIAVQLVRQQNKTKAA